MRLPERVGHYRIVDVLGHGTLGTVYRAVDETSARSVALKVLSAAAVADTDRWARFRSEAGEIARLRHPNITSLYELGHHGEIPFLAFELLQGIDLAESLTSNPRPRATAAIPVLLQVLTGLEHAHENGIYHRDLRASRIFLPRGREAKIRGFGMALLREPAAVAPADGRHDLFALGLVLHELVVGRPAPASGPDLAQVPTGHEWARLRAVLRRALSTSPGGGYADAPSMTGDLATALMDLDGPMHWTRPVDPSLFPTKEGDLSPAVEGESAPSLPHSSAAVRPRPSKARHRNRGGRRLLRAAAALVLILVGGAVLGWKHLARTPGPATPPPATPVPATPTPPPTAKPAPTRAPVKPTPPTGSIARANEHLDNRRYPQALAEARAVLRREPGNSEAQDISEEAQAGLAIDGSLQTAREELKRGNKEAAREALKRGLAINQDDARLRALWREATE